MIFQQRILQGHIPGSSVVHFLHISFFYKRKKISWRDASRLGHGFLTHVFIVFKSNALSKGTDAQNHGALTRCNQWWYGTGTVRISTAAVIRVRYGSSTIQYYTDRVRAPCARTVLLRYGCRVKYVMRSGTDTRVGTTWAPARVRHGVFPLAWFCFVRL